MVRSNHELSLMRASGRISAKALKEVLSKVAAGVSLAQLDAFAENEILSLGGKSSFKTEPGYKWTTCLTVNSEVVHGTPREIKLKTGDKLSVDLGAVFKGWHTDCAWSVIVGGKQSKFLSVGEQAMWKGIAQAIDGNRMGDISHAIQETIEGSNYHVVRSLIGHGVGKSLHEKPDVPGYGNSGEGVLLKEGMTLAIEAIYTQGTSEVIAGDDGWAVLAADGSMGGLFEMTVIVGKKKAEVLTDWRRV